MNSNQYRVNPITPGLLIGASISGGLSYWLTKRFANNPGWAIPLGVMCFTAPIIKAVFFQPAVYMEKGAPTSTNTIDNSSVMGTGSAHAGGHEDNHALDVNGHPNSNISM
jgi:hypothetical protein